MLRMREFSSAPVPHGSMGYQIKKSIHGKTAILALQQDSPLRPHTHHIQVFVSMQVYVRVCAYLCVV